MKPDKLPLRLMIALSGAAIAGVWTIRQHFVSTRSPGTLPTAADKRSGDTWKAAGREHRPPPAVGGGVGISSRTEPVANKATLTAPRLNPVPGRLPEISGSITVDRPDGQSISKAAKHLAATPRQQVSASASLAATPAAVEAPSFRAIAGDAPQPDSGPVAARPVILEFADHQQLPAVLVADAQTDAADDPRQATAQAMAARIAQEFISEVNSPEPEPSSPSDPVADPSAASGKEHDAAADTVNPPRNPAANPEQRWDAAAQAADDQYRLLIGQDEYQQKAIQAAILKVQQSVPVP